MMSSSQAANLHSNSFPSRFFSSASALGQSLAPMTCVARLGFWTSEVADICRVRKSRTGDNNSFPSQVELSKLSSQTSDLLLPRRTVAGSLKVS